MVSYNENLRLYVLRCDRCDKVFIPEMEAEGISELRALSVKYGWGYIKKFENGCKIQENICPRCVDNKYKENNRLEL